MEGYCSSFIRWLWDNSVAATLLCGIVLLVTGSLGRKLPAWFRYGLWLLVMFRLIWPSVPAAEFSMMNLAPAGESQFAPPANASAPISSVAGHVPLRTGEFGHGIVLCLIWAAGVIGALLLVWLRHRKLSRWVEGQPAVTDTRLHRILAEAQDLCAIRAGFSRIVLSPDVSVPAVFRWRKPVLLLPHDLVRSATDHELRLVMAHELIHVKRHDVLINWFGIVVCSLHWFNLAAWFAWCRLCAEREQVCDAAIVSRLDPAQRFLYGSILIKLATQVAPTFPRSLVIPIIHKPEIHRRITMISQYKRAPVAVGALAVLIVLVIACVAFTRAAQKPVAPPVAAQPLAVTAPAQSSAKALDRLAQELDQQEARVRQRYDELNEMRAKLGITTAEDESGVAASATVHKMAAMVLDARAEHRRLESHYEFLSGLSRPDLKKALPTVLPDPHLGALMEQLHSAEQKVADLTESHAAEHPDFKRANRVLQQIKKQIDESLDGILAGTRLKLKVEEARMQSLEKQLAEARDRALEQAVERRPYEQALRKLRTEEQFLERLRLRAMQDRLDSALQSQ